MNALNEIEKLQKEVDSISEMVFLAKVRLIEKNRFDLVPVILYLKEALAQAENMESYKRGGLQ